MRIFTNGAEARLVEKLSEIRDEHEGWGALCFAFSELMEQYSSEYQIKIALNMMNDLLRNEEGGIFVCEDQTVFILCDNIPQQKLDKVIFQLRYLFMDDPLAYTPDGEENPRFCTFYNLENNYEEFAALARRKMLGGKDKETEPNPATKHEHNKIEADSSTVATAGNNKSKATGIIQQVKQKLTRNNFFNASNMVNIEEKLKHIDFTNVIRRQPICAAIPDMRVRRVFDELYINIAHLREAMNIDVDLLSNRWLFKYLTELLDRRVLEMMKADPSKYVSLPLSLNLNVHTLISDAFQEFDAAIKPSVKVSIVIEIQIADVFEDMRAFSIARNMAKKLGYRVCLDGITELSFPQIDREKLGFDLVKLQWNADILSDLNRSDDYEIAKMVQKCGANRIILTRCDNKMAVDYGQALGISLFQGRYLDKLMNPSSEIEN